MIRTSCWRKRTHCIHGEWSSSPLPSLTRVRKNRPAVIWRHFGAGCVCDGRVQNVSVPTWSDVLVNRLGKWLSKRMKSVFRLKVLSCEYIERAQGFARREREELDKFSHLNHDALIVVSQWPRSLLVILLGFPCLPSSPAQAHSGNCGPIPISPSLLNGELPQLLMVCLGGTGEWSWLVSICQLWSLRTTFEHKASQIGAHCRSSARS